MIGEITMYMAECDNCLTIAEDLCGQYSCLVDPADVEVDIHESGWKVDKKDNGTTLVFCPECFVNDLIDDKYSLVESRKDMFKTKK
jgi:hypothetical protein